MGSPERIREVARRVARFVDEGHRLVVVPSAMAGETNRLLALAQQATPEARRLDTITFEEMLEAASLGSKVLQIRSVEFAGKYQVKLRVLSSFTDVTSTDMGTLITFEEDDTMEQAIISNVAHNKDEAKI